MSLKFFNSFPQVSKKIGQVLRAFTGDDSLPLPTEMIRHKWTEVSMSTITFSSNNHKF